MTHGGPSRALLAMERALSAKGVNVTTLATDDDGPGRRLGSEPWLPQTLGVTRVYCRKWFDSYKIAPGVLPWLWRHVRAFDVVHIHALFSFPSVAAALIARWRGVPYIVRPLGTLNVYGMTQRRPMLKRLSFAALEGPALRAAAAVHFTSAAEWKEAELLGVPIRGVVASLSIEAEVPGNVDEFLRLHPECRGRRILLYLSRIDPKKNLEGLIEALVDVRKRFKEVILLIAGDGPPAYLRRLKTLGKTSGLEAELVWLGHVDGFHKALLFAAAEVFVLPSYSENFGIAVAEAMAAGLPCVLGEGVAIAEQAQKSGAATVIDPSPKAIALALNDLLGDDAQRLAMGVRARDLAQREFSTQSMTDNLLALYERVATNKRRGAASC